MIFVINEEMSEFISSCTGLCDTFCIICQMCGETSHGKSKVKAYEVDLDPRNTNHQDSGESPRSEHIAKEKASYNKKLSTL